MKSITNAKLAARTDAKSKKDDRVAEGRVKKPAQVEEERILHPMVQKAFDSMNDPMWQLLSDVTSTSSATRPAPPKKDPHKRVGDDKNIDGRTPGPEAAKVKSDGRGPQVVSGAGQRHGEKPAASRPGQPQTSAAKKSVGSQNDKSGDPSIRKTIIDGKHKVTKKERRSPRHAPAEAKLRDAGEVKDHFYNPKMLAAANYDEFITHMERAYTIIKKGTHQRLQRPLIAKLSFQELFDAMDDLDNRWNILMPVRVKVPSGSAHYQARFCNQGLITINKDFDHPDWPVIVVNLSLVAGRDNA